MYELAIMLKPLLPDDIRKAIHKAVLTLVAEKGGSVKDIEVWGKRFLAYEIDSHKEGYFLFYYVELPSSAVAEVTRLLRLKQEILRLMFVKLDKKHVIGTALKKKELDISI